MAEGSARTKLATVALVIVGFALGFAVFNAGNLLAIVAPTYETLLVARVLTAVVFGRAAVYGNDIYQRHHSS